MFLHRTIVVQKCVKAVLSQISQLSLTEQKLPKNTYTNLFEKERTEEIGHSMVRHSYFWMKETNWHVCLNIGSLRR